MAMVKEFRFPDLGEGVTEGEIKKWLVKEGEEVKKDQSIAEVETDKAVVEMPSPYAGRIRRIGIPEGSIVKVGEVLASYEDDKAEKVPEKAAGSVSVVGELPESSELVVSNRPPPRAEVAKVPAALPSVRKLAQASGVDLSHVRGTGPQGRITEDDVRAAGGEKATPIGPRVQPKFDLYGWIDRKPLRGVRRSIAKHMVEARSMAALVTADELVDVTDLVELRERLKAHAQEVKGVKLTYLPFVMKAVLAALKKNPVVNSSMDEENEEIVVKKYYNLGIAVATDDGLMVPVVKAADQKDIFVLAKELVELAEAARSRKIDLADLKGGTFSITNYGAFGGTTATPIPNYPEAAILGTGRIRDAPMVRDSAVVPRKVMDLSLTFDHRVLDGAQAASFLSDLRHILETPELLLLDP
jgi:pyruvate dehydrogenase E2 component (dihydrolipoamide acetyltransferase)